MRAFASDLNHPAYERHILRLLETELDAIDVSGLSAWERAVKVYGGLTERVAVPPTEPVARSVSPVVQDPLFPAEEAA